MHTIRLCLFFMCRLSHVCFKEFINVLLACVEEIDQMSLVDTDIAATSVEQSESRYREMGNRGRQQGKSFTAEFLVADCTKVICRSRSGTCNNKLLP